MTLMGDDCQEEEAWGGAQGKTKNRYRALGEGSQTAPGWHLQDRGFSLGNLCPVWAYPPYLYGLMS